MLTRIKHVVHCTAVNSPLGLKLPNEGTVTDNETDLVVALEADIQIWASLVRYVEHSIKLSHPKNSALDDIRGLRELIR